MMDRLVFQSSSSSISKRSILGFATVDLVSVADRSCIGEPDFVAGSGRSREMRSDRGSSFSSAVNRSGEDDGDRVTGLEDGDDVGGTS